MLKQSFPLSFVALFIFLMNLVGMLLRFDMFRPTKYLYMGILVVFINDKNTSSFKSSRISLMTVLTHLISLFTLVNSNGHLNKWFLYLKILKNARICLYTIMMYILYVGIILHNIASWWGLTTVPLLGMSIFT